jgi:hypothetical protein
MTFEQAQNSFATLQARAVQSGINLRLLPPIPTTCCGKGCAGCVWESYFDAAQFWIEDAQAILGSTGQNI